MIGSLIFSLGLGSGRLGMDLCLFLAVAFADLLFHLLGYQINGGVKIVLIIRGIEVVAFDS